LPVWLIIVLTLSTGVGLWAAALSVSYRDVQYILPVSLQLLLYGSPVAYAVAAVPVRLRPLYALNPLVPILEGFRSSLLGTTQPGWASITYAAGFSAALFTAGAFVFKRMERRFADVI
jgi:lipopolysaccharide transport system permease protein